MTARVSPFVRPVGDAPRPVQPPLAGSVVLSARERAALSDLNLVAQQLARLNSGPSAAATMVARMPDLIAAGLNALSVLNEAHQEANERGR